MARAIEESNRRRSIQLEYNSVHQITPASIQKNIEDVLGSAYEADYVTVPAIAEEEAEYLSPERIQKKIKQLHKKMMDAAKKMEFEEAAFLRDQIKGLQERDLELRGD